jgi:hypothetical protein
MSEYALVERMLPARFLTELGIYLQSAAHLELAVWQIVMYSDGQFEPEPNILIEYLETKKHTPVLVDQLKKSVAKLPPSIGIRVSMLASKISQGLQNRNLAAHGAFFVDSSSSNLHVSHYYAEGKKPNRKWYEANERIPRRTIVQAIEEIDGLLREAVSIRNAIEKQGNKAEQAIK